MQEWIHKLSVGIMGSGSGAPGGKFGAGEYFAYLTVNFACNVVHERPEYCGIGNRRATFTDDGGWCSPSSSWIRLCNDSFYTFNVQCCMSLYAEVSTVDFETPGVLVLHIRASFEVYNLTRWKHKAKQCYKTSINISNTMWNYLKLIGLQRKVRFETQCSIIFV